MRWLLLLLAVVSSAHAQAPSLLGLCHKDWNCTATLEMYADQDVIVAGWLEGTFANDCQCADRLLNDARPKIVRIHLVNSPCMRNKRCGRYEALYKQTAASASRQFVSGKGIAVTRFKRVLARAKARLDKAVNVTCYVSPCLECDLYGPARRVMAAMVSAALPNCQLVDNPYRQRCIRGTICEGHGVAPRVSQPCIVDLDGIDGATVDIQKWVEQYQHCDLRYYWEPWMNCIRGDFIDPRARNCRYNKRIFDYTKERLCRYFYPLSDTCLR